MYMNNCKLGHGHFDGKLAMHYFFKNLLYSWQSPRHTEYKVVKSMDALPKL